MYIVQGYYRDSRICFEESFEDEASALALARRLHCSPWFEGDETCVITVDGELVWVST